MDTIYNFKDYGEEMSQEFYQLDAEAKKPYFELASSLSGKSFEVLEKDYWVVWTLNQLFSLPDLEDHLTFKGGTSLSKVYGIINRFSEDIDVSIERSFLGYGDDKAPENMPSKNKQAALLDDISKASAKYIQERLLPDLTVAVEKKLGTKDGWKIIVDPDDAQTLLFYYPAITKNEGYIRQFVKIEMGARSEHWPVSIHSIQSYVKTALQNKILEPETKIRVLNAERTFWEKATILHQYAHLPDAKPLPTRLSRHLYDFHQLLNSPVKEIALQQLDLLERVANHKKIYFSSGWANYDSARKGTLKLYPQDRILSELESDFKQMQPMFFGDVPKWKAILESIKTFEESFNK